MSTMGLNKAVVETMAGALYEKLKISGSQEFKAAHEFDKRYMAELAKSIMQVPGHTAYLSAELLNPYVKFVADEGGRAATFREAVREYIYPTAGFTFDQHFQSNFSQSNPVITRIMERAGIPSMGVQERQRSLESEFR